jgi:hypothetical protein
LRQCMIRAGSVSAADPRAYLKHAQLGKAI